VSVAWTQVSGPAAAVIADSAAARAGVTFPAVPGTYVFQLAASDSALMASDEVTVTLTAANQAPVVAAGPDQTTTYPSPAQVTLSGTASDDGLPPGNPFVVAWTQIAGRSAPLTSPNALATAVRFEAVGSYTFRLSVSDGTLTLSDDVTIDVLQGNCPPVVEAGANQNLSLPTRETMLAATITDDGLPAGASVSVRWTAVSGPGLVIFGNPLAASTAASFDAPGTYTLQVLAHDGDLSASDVLTVTVQGLPASGDAPVVALTAPADVATVTSPVDVTGTVSSGSLVAWRLEYNEPSLGDDWQLLATGTAPVANQVLGRLDPTILLNGIYQIRLAAVDSSGRSASDQRSLVVRGNMKVGNFSVAFSDLTVPVAGIPIEVLRTYDSRNQHKGDFGVGWSLSLSGMRVSETRKLGKGWAVVQQPGFFPTYCVQSTRTKRVTITLSDGRVFEFEPVVEDGCATFYKPDYVTIGFRALSGTHATLAATNRGEALVQGSELYDDVDFQLLDPSRYTLTLPDGQEFIIGDRTDSKPGVQSIRDRNGNMLSFGPSGITHDSGKTIAFTRDARGRILAIRDALGSSLTYAYDPDGNLASVVDREGSTTRLVYDESYPHYLRDIVDPRGVRAIRNEYDDNGRWCCPTTTPATWSRSWMPRVVLLLGHSMKTTTAPARPMP
jgi:YD repeat-containing protein